MLRKKIVDSLVALAPSLVLFIAKIMTPLVAVLAVVLAGTSSKDMWKHKWDAFVANRALHLFLIAMVVWPLISTLWSIVPGESFSIWARVSSMCLVGIIAFLFIDTLPPTGVKTVIVAIVGFILFNIAFTLEIFTVFKPIQYICSHWGGNYTWFMNKTVSRGLCALAVFVWPLLFALYRLNMRWVSWFMVATTFVALFLSQSDSAKLGIFLSICVFILLSWSPKRMSQVLQYAVPLCFFVAPFFFWWAFHAPNMAWLVEIFSKFSNGRVIIWRSLMEHATGHWWLGWGMESARHIYMPPEIMLSLDIQKPPLHPHHSPIHVALELGLVGLSLFSYALFSCLKKMNTITDVLARNIAISTTVAFIGAGMFSFGIWQNWWVATGWFSLLLWKRMATSFMAEK